MELLILVLLLVLLARLRKPLSADVGLLLPALRMSAALLVVVFIGMVVMELF